MTTTDIYKDKTVLVTGAGGYIGSALSGALDGSCGRLIRHGRNPQGNDWIDGDITDPDFFSCIAAHNIDVVFHLAGQTSVYVSAENPIDDLKVNGEATLRLLEAIRLGGKPVGVVIASTASVVGMTVDATPVDETRQERPTSIYDADKLLAEHYLRLYATDGHVRGASLRLANVYGPSTGEQASGRGVLNKMVTRALAGDDLTVFRPGDWVRDYIYIDDVVAAFLAAVDLDGEAYTIGSGVGITLKDAFGMVVERVAAVTGKTVAVNDIDAPDNLNAIEFRHYVADTSAFQAKTGWQAQTSLVDGIDATIRAFSV